MEMCIESILKIIGDRIGNYIRLEEGFLSQIDRTVKILVEIDLTEGLPEELKIKFGEWYFVQVSYYWNIPFRCSWCHKISQIWKDRTYRKP